LTTITPNQHLSAYIKRLAIAVLWLWQSI